MINSTIVAAVDQASGPWGIKVNRYEILNIVPPKSVLDAMEKEKKLKFQNVHRFCFRKEKEIRESIVLSVSKRKRSTNRKGKNKEGSILRKVKHLRSNRLHRRAQKVSKQLRVPLRNRKVDPQSNFRSRKHSFRISSILPKKIRRY